MSAFTWNQFASDEVEGFVDFYRAPDSGNSWGVEFHGGSGRLPLSELIKFRDFLNDRIADVENQG